MPNFLAGICFLQLACWTAWKRFYGLKMVLEEAYNSKVSMILFSQFFVRSLPVASQFRFQTLEK